MTVTAAGGITNGDQLMLIVHDKTRTQAQSFSYTINSSVDTSTTLIATHFVSTNSSALSAIGVTATSAGNVITLTSGSANVTAFTASTNTGATEQRAIGTSKGAQGTIGPSNTFQATPILAGGTSSTSNTASVTALSGGGTSATNNYNISINGSTPSSLSYDSNGNMTSDGTNSYSWDAENRLVQITYPGSGNNTQFVFDPLSRCVKIVETTGGSITSTQQFVWCGGQRCEMRDASGSLSNGKQFFPLGQINFSSGTGTNYFYTLDHLGSVREVTNNAGSIQGQFSYDPYVPTVLAGTFVPDFGYTRFYQHSRSGLNLAVFRPYSAPLGRWMSRDPIGENGGTNLYGYVANNPISSMDPLGLADTASVMGAFSAGFNSGTPLGDQMVLGRRFFDTSDSTDMAALYVGSYARAMVDMGVGIGILKRGAGDATEGPTSCPRIVSRYTLLTRLNLCSVQRWRFCK
jgi:RHS repeat-associated protein